MFSNKLKNLRKKSGLTQAELSEKLGIGQSTIGMYESNIRRPSYEVIKKIADYFNVTVDYLISDNDIENIDDTDDLISFSQKIKNLSPKQKEQVRTFIDYILYNPPK